MRFITLLVFTVALFARRHASFAIAPRFNFDNQVNKPAATRS